MCRGRAEDTREDPGHVKDPWFTSVQKSKEDFKVAAGVWRDHSNLTWEVAGRPTRRPWYNGSFTISS